MNYKRIYKQIVEKARNQNRVKYDGVYYESHHIIPDFMFKDRKRIGPPGHLHGNPNDKTNKVNLTPREHFICHVLLVKILKGTRYELSAASALQFFFTKVINKHPRSKHNLPVSLWYEKCRQIGLTAISKARRGKMPVKDAITGVMIGSIETDHPKVLSGEWVHHSRGKTLSEDEKRKKSSPGERNGRYSGKTDEQLYEFARSFFIDRGYFQLSEFHHLCKIHGYPILSTPKNKPTMFRFKEYGGGTFGLIQKLSEEFGIIPTIKTHRQQVKQLKEIFNAKNHQDHASRSC